MNSNVVAFPGINLFEKKHLASRIACLVLAVLLLMYMLPISTRGLGASIISGGLALVLAVQFILQSKIANIILGGIMFMIGGYFSLAVVSEFNEFEIIAKDAWLLFLVGLLLCFSVMAMSIIMIWQAMKD